MSSIDRQNSLLAAEDWKKVYQTFREADFQSYDFETLRKTMIDYLRLYYPEDFNDFIESSEYIALIDLIAFLGQSLAFRTDLNSRENFLDTAERRDSILKLARLVGYSPKRCIPASGLLKITSIATTESVIDSNGYDLANLAITWNDVTNSNWLEQFTIITNATLLNSQVIGKPGNSQSINSIKTDEYTINITPNTLPAFRFSATVGGTSMQFEAVSATSVGQPYIYEVPPKPLSKFNVLYRNDNQGNGSINTGFFMYFKQGALQSADFTVSEALPNRVLSIGFSNINNSDVWLYDVASDGTANTKWTAVPAVAGINVIYNKSAERNLYQINTTAGDQIDLVFGDGSFANVPQGAYRLFFRTSNSQSYKVTPDEIQNATITMPYISRAGQQETLTIRANLNYTVANATSNESSEEIRSKAPQQYYTQGRMITGEDYNIVPFTAFSDILKAKAVNRTSSGVSRFLDVNDSSGKYSSTNIFAQDGFLYRESKLDSTSFTFLTSSGVQQLIQDELTIILGSKEIQHFYYENVLRTDPYMTELVNGVTTYRPVLWNVNSINSDGCTGYMYYDTTALDPVTGKPTPVVIQVGDSTSATTKDVKIGSILKFAAPEGYYFNTQNHITQGTPKFNGDKMFIYTSVTSIVGDGTFGGAISPTSKQGPVTLSVKVPSTATLIEIIPVFKSRLPTTVLTTIVNKILSFNNFALRYDLRSANWVIVEDYNLTNPISTDFSWTNAGGPADDSWLIRFEYSTNVGYNIYWRSTNYYFESLLESKFYFDEKVKIYDSKTGSTIKDIVKILKVNQAPTTSSTSESMPLGVDFVWNVHKNVIDLDGYENQSKVLLTFTDTNADGIPDNPDIFDMVVAPEYDAQNKLVFFEREINYTGFVSYAPTPKYINSAYEFKSSIDATLSSVEVLIGDLYYTTGDNKFYKVIASNASSGKALEEQVNIYKAYVGRGGASPESGGLYFQYRHNSPSYRRIDPSPSNIIDLYMLTKVFASDYQTWVRDTTGAIEEPQPPTTDQLSMSYGTLENYKAISDTIIFNSAKFKSLFGAKADPLLQATFKVVKNASLNLSDNDIKSNVVNAINTYFSVDNWDFGETFYFSELSAYLHSSLSPNVSSIIIVPLNPTSMFGSLYQINAEANEILSSSATVDNIEIISAITAAAINANFSSVNNSITLGNI